MNKHFKNYLYAMILPLVILFSMTILPIYTLTNGTEFLLKTKPVDPTDLFRGDYVILDYEISEIKLDKLDQELQDKLKSASPYELQGKDIYVVLRKGKTYHEVTHATLQKPIAGLYLKGKINYLNEVPMESEKILKEKESLKEESVEYSKGKIVSLVVNYNLDKYFVPENTGTELEELSRKGQLVAKVKVSKGYAILADVFAE